MISVVCIEQNLELEVSVLIRSYRFFDFDDKLVFIYQFEMILCLAVFNKELQLCFVFAEILFTMVGDDQIFGGITVLYQYRQFRAVCCLLYTSDAADD